MTEAAQVGGGRRVALVANTDFYVGPPLARLLATRGHDLVLGDPQDGLVDELEDLGAAVEAVTDVRDLSDPRPPSVSSPRVSTGSVASTRPPRSGRVVTGRFLKSSIDDLRPSSRLPRSAVPLPEGGRAADGRAGRRPGAVVTSAAGARPTPGAPLYSRRAPAPTMLVRNVADEVARNGVQVNALGTNFMDFPEFLRGQRARPTPRCGPRSRRRCRCAASAPSRSARRSACRSSTAPAASPPASSSPTPAAGRKPQPRG